jgi:diaminopimelate decarboxylase
MISTPLAAAHPSGCQYLPNLDADELSPNQCLMPLTARMNDHHHLEIGGCDVVELVQKFGSPLYILDEETFRTACRQYRDSFQQNYPGESLVLYASKAWNCLVTCAIAASEGLGLDVVSGGELQTALQAGVQPDTIYLHGNNKSVEELQMAIATGCKIVVDSWYELQLLAQIAAEQPKPVAVLLRLTPGIECHTHDYIRTGHLDSKFGFDPDQVESVFQFVQEHPQLQCIGLHAHIGSQIFELNPHRDLGEVMVNWLVKAVQYGITIQELDIGGGLGIRYTEADDPPSISQWVKVVCESVVATCKAHQIPLPKLLAEPGRSLIGTSCVTAYTVGSQKTVPGIRTYVAVDGGMSDNPRPITYQSVYRAVVANRMADPLSENPVTVAGKHCESGDIVIREAKLPALETGDVLVVLSTGAYNYSMASNYNRVPRPAGVLVYQGDASLMLQRETYEDLIRQDRLPERLVI